MLVVPTYPVKEPNSLENCNERNYEQGVDILRKMEKHCREKTVLFEYGFAVAA